MMVQAIPFPTTRAFNEAHTQWLHGIPHLTKDASGYVYWRGVDVTHFTYSVRETLMEQAAAVSLAEKCKVLEHNSVGVTARTVLLGPCYTAPPGTPWLFSVRTYDAFFTNGKEVAGVFGQSSTSSFDCAVVRKRSTGPQAIPFAHRYMAYECLAHEGFNCIPLPETYDQLVNQLEQLAIPDAELSKLICTSFINI